MHKYPQANKNVMNIKTRLQREALFCRFNSHQTQKNNHKQIEKNPTSQMKILFFKTAKFESTNQEF